MKIKKLCLKEMMIVNGRLGGGASFFGERKTSFFSATLLLFMFMTKSLIRQRFFFLAPFSRLLIQFNIIRKRRLWNENLNKKQEEGKNWNLKECPLLLSVILATA